MSVVFDWDIRKFENHLKSAVTAEEIPYFLKYMPKDGKILEAGCGMGRFVHYLSERGFNVVGVELGQEVVSALQRVAPELNVICGNVTKLPFGDNTIAGIISIGLVEHFIDGPRAPLAEFRRVLQPGRFAVITAPSYNLVRRLRCALDLGIQTQNRSWRKIVRQSNVIRRFVGKPPLKKHEPGRLPFRRRGQVGADKFFQYFLSRREFERELRDAGFRIVESMPIQSVDGLYHEFGDRLARFDGVSVKATMLGRLVNTVFSLIPFCHNHMHLCVATRDE